MHPETGASAGLCRRVGGDAGRGAWPGDRRVHAAPRILDRPAVPALDHFTGPIAWRPILISALFLLLANIGGAIFVGRDVVGIIRRRRTARNAAGPLPRELLDQIVAGVTTYEDLVTLCGQPDEEHEHFAPSVRRTLIYRGTGRIPAPAARRRWGRAAGHGQVEHHEVAIDVDGDRVQAVQSRVRRVRATS
jgi:hypothetical protein